MADSQDGRTFTDNTWSGLEDISRLAPEQQQNLQLLVENLQKGKVKLSRDNGNICVEDMESISYRGMLETSYANTIQTGKSDIVLKNKIESCIDLIEQLKQNKNPSGVILDSTKATAIFGRYLEGEGFERTEEKLGKGVSGDIVVVRDKKLDEKHAMKTMMLTVFRTDEIRCWTDLNDKDFVPSLYVFRMEGNKVFMHMEILENAISLKDVIDEQMSYIRESDSKNLVRPFALYVFHGLLTAVDQMNEANWTHGDFHGGNAMLSEDVKIKVIDFGAAKPLGLKSAINYKSFQNDIQNIVGIFCGLYVSDELRYDDMINSPVNFKRLWKDRLEVQPLVQIMTTEDKEELFCLIDSALQISGPNTGGKEKLLQNLQSKLDNIDMENVLQKIANILFKKELEDEQTVDLSQAGEFDYPDGTVVTDGPKLKRCNSETMIDRLRQSLSVGHHHINSECSTKYASAP